MLVLTDLLAVEGVLPGQDWPAHLVGKTEGFEQMWEFRVVYQPSEDISRIQV